MPSDLLSIEPSELKFPIELGKQVTSSLQVINQTESDVAFKIKTTAPKNYCVRPNIGTVAPGGSCSISVTMRAFTEVPQDMQSKDKFLVQSVHAPHGSQHDTALQELFHKSAGNEINEARLKVVFVEPSPTSENVTGSVSRQFKTVEDPSNDSLNMESTKKRETQECSMAQQKRASGFSFFSLLVVAVLGILAGFVLRGELYV